MVEEASLGDWRMTISVTSKVGQKLAETGLPSFEKQPMVLKHM